MIVVPLIPAHFEGFIAQDEQNQMMSMHGEDFINFLCDNESYALTVDGKAIAMAGLYNIELKYYAWVILSKESNKYLFQITKEIKRFMYNRNVNLNMFVRKGFKAGERWAKIFGFQLKDESFLESPVDNKIYSLYTRCVNDR